MQTQNLPSHAAAILVSDLPLFFSPRPDSGCPAIGSFLTYHVNIDFGEEFYADVRDAYGRTVFELDGDPSVSGLMSGRFDLVGLKRVLMQRGVMTAKQELVGG
ncbi:hypothetical protein APB26_31765 [Pseudomonas aeruginosa]|uniref:hypothetical protein n=1 Tax=Pseudomonas aeruginosa TaxID=287 RepID=UPI00071B8EAD|nr:hypothetical protein [Pseudomonas aeruginosa]KSQ21567.1 hypothetical protein APB26_31765 [Pseudomonas aeruginosa]RPV61235.1 hypothetical protein IPC838_18090 [Pseudomonas aeruginosa]